MLGKGQSIIQAGAHGGWKSATVWMHPTFGGTRVKREQEEAGIEAVPVLTAYSARSCKTVRRDSWGNAFLWIPGRVRSLHPIKCEVSRAPGWRGRARVGRVSCWFLGAMLPKVSGRSIPFISYSPHGKIVYLTFTKETLIFSRSTEQSISTKMYHNELILVQYWLQLWYLQQELCSSKWNF